MTPASDGSRPNLEKRLSSFGQRVCEGVEGVESYAAFHPSRVYKVAGNLVFTPVGTRENELAVVSVHLKADVGWTFEVSDQDGVVIAESSAHEAADAGKIEKALSSFLTSTEPLVIAALTR